MSIGGVAITSFRVTTSDLDRLTRFYQALGFAVGVRHGIPQTEIALLGLEGSGTRVPLSLGAQRVDLDCFDRPGNEYPANVDGGDLCFQHFALVTRNSDAAWARAMSCGARAISLDGPVTLPASSGGVRAAKFRDPEGHPLEFLQLSSDSAGGGELLAIDHSAISVSDLDRSISFYQHLGLRQGKWTLNTGPAQEKLDDIPGPIVDVVAMMPSRASPHLELLAYRTPRGRRVIAASPNDVASTRTVWRADQDAFIRDPDGHMHLLEKKA